MTLYSAVLKAQRERECVEDLGGEGPRKCKSPICDRTLQSDNESGFCAPCQQYHPGRRWYLLSLKHWRSERRKYMAELRVRLDARGICIVCMSRPAIKRTCAECRAKQCEYMKRKWIERRREGRCVQCPLTAVEGSPRCQKHRAQYAASARKRRAVKKLEVAK